MSSNERAGLFYSELLKFLQRDGEKNGRFEEKKIRFPFSEEVLQLFAEKEIPHLEKLLFEALSTKEFHLYRGLPRLYRRLAPSESRIKKHFTHLPSLLRLGVEKPLFRLYEQQPLPHKGRIAFFTWATEEDHWKMGREAIQILKDRFPELLIDWIALVPKKMIPMATLPDCQVDIIAYETEEEFFPATIPREALTSLRKADLAIQFPTFYPHTSALMEAVQKVEADQPFPRWACFGEYGFLESSWFHPQSGHRAMGLHFLEKGILTWRAPLEAHFARLENRELLQWLFNTPSPDLLEVENYRASHFFYFTSLTSPLGSAIYLHTLFTAHREEEKGIDICTSDIGWFLCYLEQQREANRPLIEGDFRIQTIEVYVGGDSYSLPLAEKGKTVRLFCPPALTDADFRLLICLSEEWVGVSGDRSFSEAVSANKVFFYDGQIGARYFIKDLIAIAENRLSMHPNTLKCFRCMGKALLHNLPSEEGEWVDEVYFQEKEAWLEIANALGEVLQNPDIKVGFRKFNQILMQEHSFNEFFVHFIQREFTHRAFPLLAQLEEAQIALFASKHISFSHLLSSMKEALAKRKGID